MSTFTEFNELEQPAIRSKGWGQVINTNLQIIDQSVNRVLGVTTEAIEAWKVVAFDPAGSGFEFKNATISTSVYALGINITGADLGSGVNVAVLTHGPVRNPGWSWSTPGTVLYLSSSGAIVEGEASSLFTGTVPTAQPLGFVVDATTIYFAPVLAAQSLQRTVQSALSFASNGLPTLGWDDPTGAAGSRKNRYWNAAPTARIVYPFVLPGSWKSFLTGMVTMRVRYRQVATDAAVALYGIYAPDGTTKLSSFATANGSSGTWVDFQVAGADFAAISGYAANDTLYVEVEVAGSTGTVNLETYARLAFVPNTY